MNQRTHSWIAIRAIALMEENGNEPELVQLLKPHARKASVGAWIPDQVDAKRGSSGSRTENHVLKMKPYTGNQKYRFITTKADLLKSIGMHRATAQFLKSDTTLSSTWWKTPYKGDVTRPGQHLPNRLMAMSTMIKDLLLMGDQRIDQLIPGNVRFAQYMHNRTRTQEEAGAMYFFIISHFMADVCMPCHCDGRKLAAYAEGLHKQLEGHWSKKVGTGFEKRNLLSMGWDFAPTQAVADGNSLLQQARDTDPEFDIDFNNIRIPDLQPKQDVWLEVINLCRASFAVSSIIAHPSNYPYNNNRIRAPFNTVLGTSNPQLLESIDRLVMYDAVLNTAIVWKHIWNKVSK